MVGGLERARWLGGGNADRHPVAAGEGMGGAGGAAADRHGLVGDEPGGLGSGERELIGEEAVEAFGLGARTENSTAGRWAVGTTDGVCGAGLPHAARSCAICPRSGGRRRFRFRPPLILPPQHDGERDAAAAHGDIGHVERRPAERADADVEEIDHAAGAAHPVDQIARRAAGDEPERELSEPVARGTGAGHPVEHEHRDHRDRKEHPAGVRTDVQPERGTRLYTSRS